MSKYPYFSKIIGLIGFFLMSLSFYGQRVSGSVFDEKDNSALSYVNIGIPGKNIGTVSNNQGSFSIDLTQANDTDVLVFSTIGYKSKSVRVANLRTDSKTLENVRLEREIYELNEVIVKPGAFRTVNLGRSFGRTRLSAGFANNKLGNELAMEFNAGKAAFFPERFEAVISTNTYGKIKLRVNVYEAANGIPAKNILSENIFVEKKKKKGILSVDLTPYDLRVTGIFFISLELIEDMGEGRLHFVADYKGKPILTRAVSQGNWRSQDDVSLNFSVIGKQEVSKKR